MLVFAACSAGSGMGSGPSFLPRATTSSPQKKSPDPQIQHVIIMVQENRTLDNLFATFPGADGATHGKMSTGKTVKLRKVKLYSPNDMDNSHQAFVVEYNGGAMDGFNLVYVNEKPCPECAYAYVDPNDIKPYWSMAQQYALADHMFTSETSGSFNGHQDLIRGDTDLLNDSERLIDFPSHGPWGCDAPPGTTTPLLTSAGQYVYAGPAPCTTAFPPSENYATLRDLLNAHGVSWKYYVPGLHSGLPGAYWNAFDVIAPVRNGKEWTRNISSPEKTIFRDISKGKLASVSWVIPDGVNSDHSGFGSTDKGPSWVAQVVNAVGESKYWSSTAILITWDDWGGWYDHLPPPQLDYAGLGFRVPLIVVSPFAKTNYVSHTQYEFGSIIRFVEDNWNLGRLGTTDERAASLDDMFDLSGSARKFKKISAKYSREYFERQPPSNVPVDTN
jgi:phospholipase C